MSPKAKSRVVVKRRVRRAPPKAADFAGPTRTKVGIPKGSGEYPDGTLVVDVALWNEFGAGNTPERSFHRSAIRKNLRNYRALNRRNLLAIQRRSMTARTAIGRLGVLAENHIVHEIDNFKSPLNAPATIARKKRLNTSPGEPRPLVDTGVMKQAVTHEVLD